MPQVSEDNFIAFGIIFTRVDASLGGLWISYLASIKQLDVLMSVKWYDETLSRRESKMQMKEVGSAGIGYRIFLKTSAILNLAKVIEDVLFLVKERTGKNLNFWKIAGSLPSGGFAKELRSLVNIIKHNYSLISSKDSESGKYLVSERGYIDGVMLEILMMSDEGVFDIPSSIIRTYVFAAEVVEKVIGMPHPVLLTPEEDRAALLKPHLVPGVLNL